MEPPLTSRLRGHLARVVGRLRARYRKRVRKWSQRGGGKSLHALRVETRRMLALLDLLAQAGFGEDTRKLSTLFSKRLKGFGPLRDTHVQLALLEPVWKLHPQAEPLRRLLERREKKLAGALERKIGSAKHSTGNRRLKALEGVLEKTPLTRRGSPALTAERILDGFFKRTLALRDDVRPDDTSSIHRMRIAFKRFRYSCELLQPLVPRVTDQRLKRMKSYQDRIGEIQDSEVLLARIAKLIKARKLNPADVRSLRQDLQQRRSAALSAALEQLDQLATFWPVVRNR